MTDQRVEQRLAPEKKAGLFNFVPGQHKAKPVRNGIIFFVVVMAVLFMGYTKNIPFFREGATEVKAHVANSVNIFAGNEVRVNGVKVGKVTKVDRAKSGRGAIIDMDIKDEKVTVKRDARASVYWRTLLGGNFYVELQPGSRSAPELQDGGTIPLSRTSTQVEFDQLLTTFDSDARESMKIFFKEFGRGFAGGAAGTAIERLGPGLEPVPRGMSSVRGVRPGKDLPQLARGASRTFGALARREDDLAGLIEGANTTLAVTAARRQDIGTMLDQAPATFDETRTTLARLRKTLDVLDPVAEDLRPGVRRLDETTRTARPAMRMLRNFIPDAMPVLRDADPAVRKLRGAARQATPVMRELGPTLDRVTKEINPWLNERQGDTGLKTSWTIGPFFNTVGNAARNYDGNGFSLNFDTLNGLGDMISGAVDCDEFGAGKAGCELLLTTLGKALGAGADVQKAPDVPDVKAP